MLRDLSNTREILENFKDEVVRKSKKRFLRKYKFQKYRSTPGKLYKSINGKFDVFENSISVKFPFMMDINYAKFVDQGVSGMNRKVKSIYKFGSGTGRKGGLTQGIKKYVRNKGFQFRSKDGKFLSYDSTAFLIIRKIWNKGIPGKFFFSRSFDEEYRNLPDELNKAFGLDIKKKFKEFTTKK